LDCPHDVEQISDIDLFELSITLSMPFIFDCHENIPIMHYSCCKFNYHTSHGLGKESLKDETDDQTFYQCQPNKQSPRTSNQ